MVLAGLGVDYLGSLDSSRGTLLTLSTPSSGAWCAWCGHLWLLRSRTSLVHFWCLAHRPVSIFGCPLEVGLRPSNSSCNLIPITTSCSPTILKSHCRKPVQPSPALPWLLLPSCKRHISFHSLGIILLVYLRHKVTVRSILTSPTPLVNLKSPHARPLSTVRCVCPPLLNLPRNWLESAPRSPKVKVHRCQRKTVPVCLPGRPVRTRTLTAELGRMPLS